MKKTLSLALCLWTMTLSLNAQTLWSGSQEIDWSNGSYLQLQASLFADLEIGDYLVFTITYTGGAEWPQVSLNNGSWSSLAGAGNVSINESTTQVSYGVTSIMLPYITSSGIIIYGIGFTLTEVSIEKGNGESGYEDAVWFGETVFPTDWTGSAQLPASCFTNAKVGDVLRLNFTNLKAGAQISPYNSNWNILADAESKSASGIYVEYTITEDMLSELQAGGMIVGGSGFTLTMVEIIDPASLSSLSVTVPVVNNWTWTSPETPQILYQIENTGTTDATVVAELRIATDKLESVETLNKTVTIAAGASIEETFDFTISPGIYQLIAIVDGQLASTFNIAVDPTEIISDPDMQSDFTTFWQDAKDELASVDPEYTLTKIDAKSTSKRNVYLVEMNSINDNDGNPGIVRAYYAEPTDGNKHTAIIHYQGYDSGSGDPWCMGGDDNPDYAELTVSTRGQVINNRDPYTNTYGDWVVYGLESENTYYYRQAYMDVVRSIDFMASRDAVDTNNIFAEGASQGGALTLAAAALDSRLRAIAPAVPFLGDFPDYLQIASWPAYPLNNKREELGMTYDEMLRVLSYFDTKNLATMIECPVILTLGLQDNVCPPHTNLAPYNNLPENVEKEFSINAELKHETPSSWYATYMKFFTDHMQTNSIDAVHLQKSEDTARYNLAGQRVGDDYKGVVIMSGKKYLER